MASRTQRSPMDVPMIDEPRILLSPANRAVRTGDEPTAYPTAVPVPATSSMTTRVM